MAAHEAVTQVLARYDCRRLEDYLQALREILQEVALLGLWRGKFFEKAAFYGGTALRILHGLDRFSEDLGFSLLRPTPGFELEKYGATLEKEVRAFGFDVRVEKRSKVVESPIQSAFLKANTLRELLTIEAAEPVIRRVPRDQVLKIRLEVDTDPPPGFATEPKYLLRPIPFAVRAFALPDLFAGKMHAVLCSRWKNRVKGRDWYDLVWYVANHPELNLSHLEQRMRQTGDWTGDAPLEETAFRGRLRETIEGLRVDVARRQVEPFLRDPRALDVWSREFFQEVASRIRMA